MNMMKGNVISTSPSKRAVFGGFTLIELLVAMAILAILSTIAFGSFRSTQMRSRDAQRKSDLKQISNALEMFYNDKNRYPAAMNGNIVGCSYNTTTPANSTSCTWGESEFQDEATSYFKVLPTDPSGFSYYYHTLNSNRSYQLFAHLENTEDRNCILGDCTQPNTPTGLNCGGLGLCNFAIHSSDVAAVEDDILTSP